jgi:hypothetical protein
MDREKSGEVVLGKVLDLAVERDGPLGGHGRVYFVDPNRHLFEVCA